MHTAEWTAVTAFSTTQREKLAYICRFIAQQTVLNWDISHLSSSLVGHLLDDLVLLLPDGLLDDDLVVQQLLDVPLQLLLLVQHLVAALLQSHM